MAVIIWLNVLFPLLCHFMELFVNMQYCNTASGKRTFLLLNYQQIGVILLTAILWFMFLGYRDLIDPDEGRYAEIPQEMVSSGDWLTPRLNDLKYFEKPILHYWLTATVYEIFGTSNLTARLVTAMAGFITALWILYLTTQLTNVRVGFYSYLVCISSFIFVVLGHLVTVDMTLTLFMSLAFGALLLAQRRRDNDKYCRNWMLFGYAMLALATLTKGLEALLLPGATIALYSLAFHDHKIWRHLYLFKGFLLFLAIAAPWFILVNNANQGYAEFFFIKEHFLRYTTTINARNKPFWFFFVILLLGAVPWMVICIQVLLTPIKVLWVDKFAKITVQDNSVQSELASKKGYNLFNADAFIWVFCCFVLLFFSFSDSKLVPYILPIYPLLSILIAKKIDRNGIQISALFQMLSFAFLLLIFSIMLPTLDIGDVPKVPSAIKQFQHTMWWIVTVIMVGSGLTYIWRKQTFKAVSILAVTSLLAIQLLNFSYQNIAQFNSAKHMAAVIQPYLNKNTKIYSVKMFQHSLIFYLKRPVILVDYLGELAMGESMEPSKAIKSIALFKQRWHKQVNAMAIVPLKIVKSLALDTDHYKKVYQDHEKVVIVKK